MNRGYIDSTTAAFQFVLLSFSLSLFALARDARYLPTPNFDSMKILQLVVRVRKNRKISVWWMLRTSSILRFVTLEEISRHLSLSIPISLRDIVPRTESRGSRASGISKRGDFLPAKKSLGGRYPFTRLSIFDRGETLTNSFTRLPLPL